MRKPHACLELSIFNATPWKSLPVYLYVIYDNPAAHFEVISYVRVYPMRPLMARYLLPVYRVEQTHQLIFLSTSRGMRTRTRVKWRIQTCNVGVYFQNDGDRTPLTTCWRPRSPRRTWRSRSMLIIPGNNPTTMQRVFNTHNLWESGIPWAPQSTGNPAE